MGRIDQTWLFLRYLVIFPYILLYIVFDNHNNFFSNNILPIYMAINLPLEWIGLALAPKKTSPMTADSVRPLP
jgi:hypothetical protein